MPYSGYDEFALNQDGEDVDGDDYDKEPLVPSEDEEGTEDAGRFEEGDEEEEDL